MKKFLLPLLLAFALLIPTVAAEAADVPDIRQISPNNIMPDYASFYTNYSSYVYECKNSRQCAAQFVRMLTQSYSFRIVINSDTTEEYPEWTLVYTGSKKLSNIHNSSIKNHVIVSASNDEIIIDIVKGLSYAGHFVKDY